MPIFEEDEEIDMNRFIKISRKIRCLDEPFKGNEYDLYFDQQSKLFMSVFPQEGSYLVLELAPEIGDGLFIVDDQPYAGEVFEPE